MDDRFTYFQTLADLDDNIDRVPDVLDELKLANDPAASGLLAKMKMERRTPSARRRSGIDMASLPHVMEATALCRKLLANIPVSAPICDLLLGVGWQSAGFEPGARTVGIPR